MLTLASGASLNTLTEDPINLTFRLRVNAYRKQKYYQSLWKLMIRQDIGLKQELWHGSELSAAGQDNLMTSNVILKAA